MALGRQLWVVANAIVDLVAKVDQWPERGGDVLARTGGAFAGGNGFNVAAAAARLGMKTLYAGLVGTGPMGTAVQRALREAGVALAREPVAGADTGFDCVIVEPDGERTFITVPGCESRFGWEHLQALAVPSGDAVYVSGYHLARESSAWALIRWLDSLPSGVQVVWDPGPLIAGIAPDIWRQMAARVSVLTVNQREAAWMTAESDPPHQLARLRQWCAPGATVLVRAGAAGTWIFDETSQQSCRVGTRPAQAVDTTGAGDVHTGALVALWRPQALVTVVKAANVAASLAVEHLGPHWSPTWAEVAAYLSDDERIQLASQP
ncbi:MAG: PfkB family carbohydrate kinase [Firmicutes bacterium]|nr:PfkB family carbohydrate kinase [Bacillota bacterium]